jgi:Ca2+-binding RTX toxin-like protein
MANLGAGSDEFYDCEGDCEDNHPGELDRVWGGPGNDSIVGLGSQEVGNEFHGGTGADWVSGTAARDALFGGRGPDRLFGRGGADVLRGGLGADTNNGGRGSDLCRSPSTGPRALSCER